MRRRKHLLFYVYVYYSMLPDSFGVPIYVGKGHGRRAKHHARDHVWHKNQAFADIFHDHKMAGIEPLCNIEWLFADEGAALEKERELITQYGRRDRGTGTLVNLTSGGEGLSGHIFSERHRAGIGAGSKATWARPEEKAKRRAAIKAAHNRPEVKAKRNIASKAMWARPEEKAKRRAAIKAAHNRPEVKVKHSARMKRLYQDPVEREKLSAALKAACNQPEEKTRRSAAIKAANARPGVNEKRSVAASAVRNLRFQVSQAYAFSIFLRRLSEAVGAPVPEDRARTYWDEFLLFEWAVDLELRRRGFGIAAE